MKIPSSSYEILHPKCVKVFACCNILLSVTNLIVIGTFPLKVIPSDF